MLNLTNLNHNTTSDFDVVFIVGASFDKPVLDLHSDNTGIRRTLLDLNSLNTYFV